MLALICLLLFIQQVRLHAQILTNLNLILIKITKKINKILQLILILTHSGKCSENKRNNLEAILMRSWWNFGEMKMSD